MGEIASKIVELLRRGIEAIFDFIALVWKWSFGQIIEIFQSPLQQLPTPKLIVLAIVVVAVVYVLYRAALKIWAGLVIVLYAFADLLKVFVSALPLILLAGLIAFVGGWIIQIVHS